MSKENKISVDSLMKVNKEELLLKVGEMWDRVFAREAYDLADGRIDLVVKIEAEKK